MFILLLVEGVNYEEQHINDIRDDLEGDTSFSIPLILGNLFQQLYNIVDSIIVGNVVGSSALAAVGASGAIIQLLVGFCIGASAGAGVVTSQYYGARDDEGVRKAVHTTIAISIAAGAILSIIGVLTAPLILDIMGTPEEVLIRHRITCGYSLPASSSLSSTTCRRAFSTPWEIRADR